MSSDRDQLEEIRRRRRQHFEATRVEEARRASLGDRSEASDLAPVPPPPPTSSGDDVSAQILEDEALARQLAEAPPTPRTDSAPPVPAPPGGVPDRRAADPSEEDMALIRRLSDEDGLSEDWIAAQKEALEAFSNTNNTSGSSGRRSSSERPPDEAYMDQLIGGDDGDRAGPSVMVRQGSRGGGRGGPQDLFSLLFGPMAGGMGGMGGPPSGGTGSGSSSGIRTYTTVSPDGSRQTVTMSFGGGAPSSSSSSRGRSSGRGRGGSRGSHSSRTPTMDDPVGPLSDPFAGLRPPGGRGRMAGPRDPFDMFFGPSLFGPSLFDDSDDDDEQDPFESLFAPTPGGERSLFDAFTRRLIATDMNRARRASIDSDEGSGEESGGDRRRRGGGGSGTAPRAGQPMPIPLPFLLSGMPMMFGQQLQALGAGDPMSYEDLMALGERIGAVRRGARPEDIDALPTDTFKEPGTSGAETGSEKAESSAPTTPAPPKGSRSRGGGKAPAKLESVDVGRAEQLGSGGTCSICLCDYEKGEELTTLPCLHRFHKDCVSKWLPLNRTCPVCKHDIRKKKAD